MDMENLLTLLELSPDPMLVIEADGTIAAANTLAHDRLGLTTGSLKGSSIERIAPTLGTAGRGSWAMTADRPDVAVGAQYREVLLRRGDGNEIAAEIALRHIDMADTRRVIASLHDVTLRSNRQNASNLENATLEQGVKSRDAELLARTKELEQRSRELEQANAQLEAFSYSVSHDLRAPLRAISGFAQILSRRCIDRLDEQERHYLQNIVDAGKHMGRLIDDLLTYSRLGQAAVVPRPVSVDDIVRTVLSHLSPRIAASGSSIRIPEPLPVVAGDRSLMTQIMTNLLDNALTYRRQGQPASIDLSWSRIDDDAVIRIADDGIGIAAEHFERIFEVFQRLHSQEEYPGTGIGLAVVRKAIAMQRGSIRVESRPGQGSTFHIRLPLAVPNPPGASGTAAQQAAYQGKTGDDES